MIRAHVIRSIFWRNFVSYFINPTGYVFITVFVLVSAILAFIRGPFFQGNLANLDQLNEYFPVVLAFFVPAITMGAWSEERRQGTEELLLTLPVRDLEVVLGKYLSTLGIYTVALIFSLMHLAILAWLGRPDAGLMFSTYFSYWLLGAALLAVGMVGSALTASQPVAFILGAVLCALFVFLSSARALVPASWEPTVVAFSVTPVFQELSSGMVTLRGVVFFASLTVVMLHLNLLLLGRRRWSGGRTGAHRSARWVFLAAAIVAANGMVHRSTARVDGTAENLHTLSKETREILRSIRTGDPVYVHAYVSAEMSRDYAQTRKDLLSLLKEYEAAAEGRLVLQIHETEKHSEVAREAKDAYGIEARSVGSRRDDDTPRDVFLSVVFVRGARIAKIPFLYKGLSIEYELTRSIRSVTDPRRRRIGIVSTDARMAGGFNFMMRRPSEEWSFVTELRQQYDVVQISPSEEMQTGIDVLIVPQPSSLTDPQLASLIAFLQSDPPSLVPDDPCPSKDEKCAKTREGFKREGERMIVPKGRTEGLCESCRNRAKGFERSAWPVLVFEDPAPFSDGSLAAWVPKQMPREMYMQREAEQKGNVRKLFDLLGVSVDTGTMLWNPYNPYPDLELPNTFVFVKSRESGEIRYAIEAVRDHYLGPPPEQPMALPDEMPAVDAARRFAGKAKRLRTRDVPAFDAEDPVSSGLQTMILLGTGTVAYRPGSDGSYTPLLRLAQETGEGNAEEYFELMRQGRRGEVSQEKQEDWAGSATGRVYAPAARIKGRKVDAIVIADIDLVSDMFLELRRTGWENKEFDNVTFVLNCVDSLAGEETLLSLRKRRSRHRTLELIENERRDFETARLAEEMDARETARARIKEKEERFRKELEELEKRTDLDIMSISRQLAVRKASEETRLNREKREIRDEKNAIIERGKARMERSIEEIELQVKIIAAIVPWLPAFLLGLVVFFIRLSRERQTIPKERWVGP